MLYLQDLAHGPAQVISGIRTTAYRQLGDLLGDLRTAASGNSNVTSQTALLQVGPSSRNNVVNEDILGITEDDNTAICEDSGELPPEVVDLSTDTEYIGPGRLATPQETKAARTIQAAYRNFLQRRYNRAAIIIIETYRQYRVRKLRQLKRSGIEASRERWKVACLLTAREISSSSYKWLLVNSLPHTLVCLEKMYASVSRRKDEVKERLRVKGGQVALEEVHADMERNM